MKKKLTAVAAASLALLLVASPASAYAKKTRPGWATIDTCSAPSLTISWPMDWGLPTSFRAVDIRTLEVVEGKINHEDAEDGHMTITMSTLIPTDAVSVRLENAYGLTQAPYTSSC